MEAQLHWERIDLISPILEHETEDGIILRIEKKWGYLECSTEKTVRNKESSFLLTTHKIIDSTSILLYECQHIPDSKAEKRCIELAEQLRAVIDKL